jgi:hypothetical protein
MGWATADVRPYARAALAWLAARPFAVITAFGAVLRVALYAENRGFWLDEMSLRDNLEGRPAARLFAEYAHTQLAPPGFFALEWGVARVLGAGTLALRMIPLLCGLGALLGFAALARRCLPRPAALVALALFAVSGDLIVYASELKPYATDVAAAVACMWAGVAVAGEPLTPRRLIGLAALGTVVVWLSFPSALVLAAVGTVLIGGALVRGSWRDAAALGLPVAGWLASFAAEHALAARMLGARGRNGMRAFWNLGFPPWPPGSWRDAAWPLRQVLYLFVNPLDFYRPIGPWLSALPAVVFFGLGVASLWRRDRRLLALLVLPGLFGLAVAYPRLYPFHGRLVLYLVPPLLLLIAEGLSAALAAARDRRLRAALLATVLLTPTLAALYQLVEPTSGTEHNQIGDLRPGGVDPGHFPF